MIKRESATYPFAPLTDLTDYEGYFAKVSGTTVVVVTGATDATLGVITQGDKVGGQVGVTTPSHQGSVGVKLSASPGTVALGTKLVLTANGTSKALPSSAGTYIVVATALEAGAANEIIEAELLQPYSVTVS